MDATTSVTERARTNEPALHPAPHGIPPQTTGTPQSRFPRRAPPRRSPGPATRSAPRGPFRRRARQESGRHATETRRPARTLALHLPTADRPHPIVKDRRPRWPTGAEDVTDRRSGQPPAHPARSLPSTRFLPGPKVQSARGPPPRASLMPRQCRLRATCPGFYAQPSRLQRRSGPPVRPSTGPKLKNPGPVKTNPTERCSVPGRAFRRSVPDANRRPATRLRAVKHANIRVAAGERDRRRVTSGGHPVELRFAL